MTAVLPVARDVADAHDATLHVLNVADANRESLTQLRGEVIDVLERECQEIIEEGAAATSARGRSVVADVPQGDPAATIV